MLAGGRQLKKGDMDIHLAINAWLVVGLFLGMLLLVELGRRVGARRLADDPEGARAGVGAVEGAVYGLLGLLIAFTFSGAAARFDARRQLIVEEANDIGTAYLRLDLLPAEPRAQLQEKFRRYVDSRLETYRKLPDLRAAEAELARSVGLQNEIWTLALNSARAEAPPATMLLLPALNQMIDITTTRTAAARLHPPSVVFLMLGVLALVSSLLAGYGMAGGKTRSWLHMLAYAAITTGGVYVILNLEYPRLGFIRIDAFDQVLVDVRKSMN